jgi:hypothetical protein
MVGVKTMKLETISKVRFGSMNCVWLIWTIKVVWRFKNVDTNFADFATVSMSGKRAP